VVPADVSHLPPARPPQVRVLLAEAPAPHSPPLFDVDHLRSQPPVDPSGSPPPAEASVPIATPVPIKLFEVSDVVLRDDTRDTHTRCSAHHRPRALFDTHNGNGDEDGECEMSYGGMLFLSKLCLTKSSLFATRSKTDPL